EAVGRGGRGRPAAAGSTPAEQVVVAAPEQWGAERPDERGLVGAGGDSADGEQEFPDLGGAVDDRRRLGPVVDPGVLEAGLQHAEGSARGEEDRDVAEG